MMDNVDPKILRENGPELFRVLPEAVFGASKLFIRETHRVADQALVVCRSCKSRRNVTMAPSLPGQAYAFNVRCLTCDRATDAYGVQEDDKDSKALMLMALDKAVQSWNRLNERDVN